MSTSIPLPSGLPADPHLPVVVSLSHTDRQALESLSLAIVGHPGHAVIFDILQRAHRAQRMGPFATTTGDVVRFLSTFPAGTPCTVEGYPVHFAAHDGAVELHP